MPFSSSLHTLSLHDALPIYITGHAVLDPATRDLRIVRGPVFTHVLLADEINRAPAKTQSALLEVMQEYQVTLEGQTLPLPKPLDRKSTRLNSSHLVISYAVLLLSPHSFPTRRSSDLYHRACGAGSSHARPAHCAWAGVHSRAAGGRDQSRASQNSERAA